MTDDRRVIDGGLDINGTGHIRNVHTALRGRVKRIKSYAPPGVAINDSSGHGTHVSGSIIGDGYSQAMGGHIRGMAPGARLLFNAIGDHDQMPMHGAFDVVQHLKDVYAEGSRIVCLPSSYDWTFYRQQLPYDLQAYNIDRFVADHPDMIVISSAGNYGELSADPQIGGKAAAKNGITVGATMSLRQMVSYQRLAPPARSEEDIATSVRMSCRGPTVEQSPKPDISAPGQRILSAGSPASLPHPSKLSNDPGWLFENGTSSSAALVAGCAAVLREMLHRIHGISAPSAALIKALFMNGAKPLQVASEALPGSYLQADVMQHGYGQVDVRRISSILKEELAGFGDYVLSLEQTLRIHVVAPPPFFGVGGLRIGRRVKVTIVYLEPPGYGLQYCVGIGVHDVDDASLLAPSLGYLPHSIWQSTLPAIPPGPVTIRLFVDRSRSHSTRALKIAVVWRFLSPFEPSWP